MTKEKLTETLAQLSNVVTEEKPTGTNEAKFQAALVMALGLVGELLIDIKRIADALERANGG